jgi:hypothetical protein
VKRLRIWTVPVFCFVTAASACLNGIPRAGSLELKPLGTVHGRAQVLAWIDNDSFAVGRLDGTLSLFGASAPTSTKTAPTLIQVLVPPARRALEMIVRVSDTFFVSSNDEHSLTIWRKNGPAFTAGDVVVYDATYGIANSATKVTTDQGVWLVTGHSEGYVLIWEVAADRIRLLKSLNVRSTNPISSPYRLWNVRGIVPWKDCAVTGSEDGDICLIRVPSGTILSRIRYDSSALRGINNLAISGNYLVVANCSVGKADKNLWLYKVTPDGFRLLDSVNLQYDQSLTQVFDFDVQLTSTTKGIYFFASTQEGLLWWGTIQADKLAYINHSKVDCEGGAAIAIEPLIDRLAVAAFDVGIYEFSSTSPPHE